MKLKSLQLKEKRAGIQSEMDAILDSAQSENRDVSADELSKLRLLREQRDALNAQIADAEMLEEEVRAKEQRAFTFNVGKEVNRGGESAECRTILSKFSFRQLIDNQIKGRRHDGIEAEMIQQGEQEARTNGHTSEGIALPAMLIVSPEKRAALGVTTAATAGDLVQSSIGEVVEYLYPRTVLSSLGATFITGLRDGFDLINQDGGATATWEGEVDTNDESNPTVAKTAVRPKRLGAYTVFSKQLMNQAVIDVENWVRAELGIAVGQALEVAAINGSGSSPIPRGILNISGIGSVAGGTNGAVPTWANMVELETNVNAANAPMGRRAYLTTPGINGVLKTVKKDAGSGIFINENGIVNGYPMFFTSNVPSNLTKGTSSGVCHAIIFGNWEELYVLQWGGIDIVVNPYSLDTTSQVRVTINSWWDIAVRHKESFSAMKDALLS